MKVEVIPEVQAKGRRITLVMLESVWKVGTTGSTTGVDVGREGKKDTEDDFWVRSPGLHWKSPQHPKAKGGTMQWFICPRRDSGLKTVTPQQ